MASNTTLHFTTPGIDEKDAIRVVELLQGRLHAANDLHLTLKHVHWNVVGPHFISVHEMIDPQVEAVRGFADDLAERIATLGGSPTGTPGALVQNRSWDEYSIGRATTQEHLGDLDLVTQDMFIAQTDKLELFHWFIRAHLEDKSGALSTEGATSEREAADAA